MQLLIYGYYNIEQCDSHAAATNVGTLTNTQQVDLNAFYSSMLL